MVYGRSVFSAIAVLILLLLPARAAQTGVVASIAPVHSLVAGVMGRVGAPHLIVRGAGSPHSFALRPSDAAALQEAGAVFWIGDDLETFLQGPIGSVTQDAAVVALGHGAGVERLGLREGGLWPAHDESEDWRGGEADNDGESDPHVWLDPRNARAMVTQIAKTLADVDPANAEAYWVNAAALDRRLEALEAELAGILAPVAGQPFIVFHDGFQYFEHRFGLASVGAVTVNPERKPGAERISEIRQTIEARGAACVFAEPQFEPKMAQVLVEGTGARTGVLDPLGAGIEPGPDLYFEMMRHNARSAAACLSK